MLESPEGQKTAKGSKIEKFHCCVFWDTLLNIEDLFVCLKVLCHEQGHRNGQKMRRLLFKGSTGTQVFGEPKLQGLRAWGGAGRGMGSRPAIASVS